jgi:uncharacterized protein (TIGR03000 family)
MFRKTFAFGGTLLVAAALVYLTPGSSQARGGVRGGAFRAGGYHAGGYRGGVHPVVHTGGYRYNPYYGGYRSAWHRPYYGGYGWRNPYYGGWGYGYPWYGAYYGYPNYLYSNPYYNANPSYDATLTSIPTYDPGYSSFYYGPQTSTTHITPTSDSSLSSEPAPSDSSARVTVTLPAGARLWVNNQAMTLTGTASEFDSPPLPPGNQYTYVLEASWDQGGHRVLQTQNVPVTAGSHVIVRFPTPGTTGPAAPAQGK